MAEENLSKAWLLKCLIKDNEWIWVPRLLIFHFEIYCLFSHAVCALASNSRGKNRIVISIFYLKNKLTVSCISVLFVWLTSSSGHTLQGSRIPWVLCITVSGVLGRCWMHQMNILVKKLCWKRQWEAVVLGWFNHGHCSGTADIEEDAACCNSFWLLLLSPAHSEGITC